MVFSESPPPTGLGLGLQPSTPIYHTLIAYSSSFRPSTRSDPSPLRASRLLLTFHPSKLHTIGAAVIFHFGPSVPARRRSYQRTPASHRAGFADAGDSTVERLA
jgi:hypothetical protein